MSKAFTKESDAGDDDEDISLPALPQGTKNYVTPQGYARLRAELMSLLDELAAELARHAPTLRRLSAAEAIALVPVLRPTAIDGAVLDPDATDLDVNALHQGFLRQARGHGAGLVTDARVVAIDREGGTWRVRTEAGEWRAPVVANAAGAWGDQVAALAGLAPIGLQPKRRAAFLFAPPGGMDTARWPCVCGVDEEEGWYFKPDAGDAECDVEFLGAHVVRLDRVGVGRRADTGTHRRARCGCCVPARGPAAPTIS